MALRKIDVSASAAVEERHIAARWNQVVDFLSATPALPIDPDLADTKGRELVDAAVLLAVGQAAQAYATEGDATGGLLILNLANHLLEQAAPGVRGFQAILTAKPEPKGGRA